MSDADFAKLKAATQPTFESAIADDDLSKKDNAGAIAALKAEIEANKPMTEKPSPVLQDVYTLAQAYYTSTPPDFPELRLVCDARCGVCARALQDDHHAVGEPTAMRSTTAARTALPMCRRQ